MLTRRKLKAEIAKLKSDKVNLELELDRLKDHLENSFEYRNYMGRELKRTTAENNALREALQRLCDKNRELQQINSEQNLQIMSLEAQWENSKRRRTNASDTRRPDYSVH